MGNHPLAGVIEKLKRANVHLTVLQHEVGTYLNTGPYTLRAHNDTGDGKPGFTFHITAQPSLRIPCIVGDILHNVRSALDYLAHELILVNGFTPQWTTQFPICANETDFFNESIAKNRIGGVSRSVFKRLEACQPYRFEDSWRIHPLWQLHKLSNLDKHHALTISALGASCSWTFKRPDGRQFTSEFKNTVIHDGAVVGSMPREFFDPEIKTNGKITCQVSFSDAPVADLEIVNILHNLNQFVGDFVLPLFEPFFDKMPDGLRPDFHGLPPSLLSAIGADRTRLRDKLPPPPSTEKG